MKKVDREKGARVPSARPLDPLMKILMKIVIASFGQILPTTQTGRLQSLILAENLLTLCNSNMVYEHNSHVLCALVISWWLTQSIKKEF